ncbi:MAG: glycine betaine ABC transporter substrate-binding protein [Pseudomonadota bacterium]
MNKINMLFRYGCFVIFTLLAAGCSREQTVKIGVVAPMSGPFAEYGKDIANGAQIAIDELNARPFKVGGKRVRFSLVREDDKASIEEGQAAAKRLVDANVVAVFGHLNSAVSIAAAPIYAQAGIPQISVSTSPAYTRMGIKTAFRVVANDTKQSESLSKFISQDLAAKSAFVIDDQTDFGKSLADAVTTLLKSKGTLLTRESLAPATVDYAQLASRVKQSRPNTIFFGGGETTGVPFIKALRKMGVKGHFVAGDAMCWSGIVNTMESAGADDFFCSMPGMPPSWLSAGVTFVKTYQKQYGQPPNRFAPMAYDTIKVLGESMQRAKSTDPQKFVTALKNKTFSGKIAGAVEFDDIGETKHGTVVIYESINGQLKERQSGQAVVATKLPPPIPVVVGSKIDTEATLLCPMIKLALEAGGIKVTEKCSFGPTQLVRNALLEGKIDLYPEYTGNAQYLIKDAAFAPGVFKNPSKGYIAAAKADLKKNKIVWLKPAPANNTYAIAIPKKLAEAEKIASMSNLADYVNSGKQFKLAATKEFVDQEEGLKAFERVYGFKLKPEQLSIVSGINTTETESAAARGTNGVNAAMAYGTDGQIAGLDLVTLRDPKGAVDIYQPAVTIREETLKKYPEIRAIIEPIFATLDTETLSRLNAQITITGETGEKVAERYLKQKRFLK